jgi:lipid II:glycine glycyltransferase (peptidoglycan interpeptide bridge formation enzyme)
MIRLNGRAAIYGEVWYDEEPSRDCAVDIVIYRQRRAPIANARRHTPVLSLFTDLSIGEDAIADNFSKDCRYQIRRAESKDAFRIEFITEPGNRLDEFHAFYDAFAEQKSLEPSDRQWLRAASDARQLLLTSAVQNDEALVWHAYLLCGQVARIQYSASCFRNRQSDYRTLVGRANRWLHWQDILRLKTMGIGRYDWGGLFQDESTAERAGINRFKKGFGGQPERSYDCSVPVTVKGRVYLPLRDAWRRRNSART